MTGRDDTSAEEPQVREAEAATRDELVVEGTVRDDAVLEAGDPSTTDPRGEAAAEAIANEAAEADPIDTGSDTVPGYGDRTGLAPDETPLDGGFDPTDPGSWGDAAGVNADGTPISGETAFTPGDLGDALEDERTPIYEGIVSVPDTDMPGADRLDPGADLPDPTDTSLSDPTGTPSVTEATPGADERLSADAEVSVGWIKAWLKDLGKKATGKVLTDKWKQPTSSGAGAPRGYDPDAPGSGGDMPDEMEIEVSGAAEGPGDVETVDTLIQHQDDVTRDESAARALLGESVNPLDPYIDPADEVGEVPDGMVVPGGGIEKTDAFGSLIQPGGPGDDGLTAPDIGGEPGPDAMDGGSEDLEPA